MTNNPLVIIPARGGSKGIPRKNIKLLGGRPLIAYSIDIAIQTADAEHIILSTDDEEIAEVARKCGLRVDYMRPAELAADTTPSRDVMLDAMNHAGQKDLRFDSIVLLQPTSPFRTLDDVKGAMNLYSPECDMVVSVVEAACNPYYDCFEADPRSGFLHISKGEGMFTRRQDAPRAWQYNGAVYVINPRSLRQMPMGAFRKRVPFPMDRDHSLDLDTPADWFVAEALMAQHSSR